MSTASVESKTEQESPSESIDQTASEAPSENELNAPLVPQERRTRRTSIAMVTVCVLLIMYTVYFARTILMPIVAAVILTLLLRPAVRACRRYRVSDAISSAGILFLVVVIVSAMFANLIGPAQSWLSDAPEKFRDVGKKLKVIREQVEGINEATEAVKDLAEGNHTDEKPPDAPFPFAPELKIDLPEREPAQTRTETSNSQATAQQNNLENAASRQFEVDKPVPVEIQQPRLLSGLQMLTSTGSYVGGLLAEIFLMLVLTYFLLASGDVLINNVLRILPSRKEKRTTVELVHTVERGISSYLLTVTAINVCLGIAEAIAMWLLGVPNPILWGAMATLLNFVPFLGALVGTGVILLVSILSFDSIFYAFLPATIYWCLTAIEGNFITPHIIGRSMSLNPIMVFLSLSVWGWMWGVGGALLAVPILAVLKVSFDQFERTKAIGTLLGGDSSI
ncbi:MAG: AI-2E family transporter [Planctomycetaceae bacterium]|nr:AI-2E family transporter [Planctomycetaceae bacterium]